MIVFRMPAWGLIQMDGLANACSPNDSFYNASAGSYSNGTVFNMVWRTHVLQMTVFIMPARRLTQTEQFLIWFGEHVFSKGQLL